MQSEVWSDRCWSFDIIGKHADPSLILTDPQDHCIATASSCALRGQNLPKGSAALGAFFTAATATALASKQKVAEPENTTLETSWSSTILPDIGRLPCHGLRLHPYLQMDALRRLQVSGNGSGQHGWAGLQSRGSSKARLVADWRLSFHWSLWVLFLLLSWWLLSSFFLFCHYYHHYCYFLLIN